MATQPTYRESDVTNYGGQNNTYNELIYSKKEYDAGVASNSTGKQQWASNNANQHYAQLGKDEADMIRGMDTQQLIDYVNGKQKPQAQTQSPSSSQGSQMNSILGNLQNSSNAMYEQQRAALEQSKAQQIANIELAYNKAVEEGRMSIQDARNASAKQIEGINSQHYNDNELMKINATQRGVSNSQQMSGMQASNNVARNTQVTSATNSLNSTLTQLQQRMNTLGLNRAVEINNANQQYDLQTAQAKAQSNSDYYNSMFQVGLSDYEANRDHGNNLEVLNKQLQNDVSLSTHKSNLTINEMTKQLGIDLQKMDYGSQLELVHMAQQHGYDMAKMKNSQAFEAMMQKSQQSFTAGQNAADRNAVSKGQYDSYMIELQRAMNQYTQGTPEYELAQKMASSKNAEEYQLMLSDMKQDQIYAYAQENPGFNASGYGNVNDAHKAMMQQVNGKAQTTEEASNPFKFINGLKDLKLTY